jgi:hypothetical protein
VQACGSSYVIDTPKTLMNVREAKVEGVNVAPPL